MEALIYYLNRQGRQERQEFSVVSQPHFLGVLGALGGLKVFLEVPYYEIVFLKGEA